MVENSEEKVECRIVLEELCDAKLNDVKISKEKFKKLSNRYGIYGIDWYFVSHNTIKYFDGRVWRYDTII